MSDNIVIPQSGGGPTDNVGNFSSSTAGTAAVTASATGATSNGVHGLASSNDASAVYGEHLGQGIGVFGRGQIGMMGESSSSYGIIGHGGDIGVYAHNTTLSGNLNDAYLASQGFAGDFHGNVNVLGNVTVSGDVVLTGADCAEEFDIAQAAEANPGTVVVLGQDGTLQQCQQAYDKRVAGVISGAGDYRPGMILDRQQSQDNRILVALVGKVYCKVDAQYAPIDVGDLLTTSPTPGHAMKAGEPLKAFGSVIGKALHGLQSGQGLVPILVALQ